MIEISITDLAGTAITYDHRIRREIRRIESGRSPNTDYMGLMSNINPDLRAGIIRDCEAQSGAAKNERDRERIRMETEKKAGGGGAKPPAEKTKARGKRRAKADWVVWRARADSEGRGENRIRKLRRTRQLRRHRGRRNRSN